MNATFSLRRFCAGACVTRLLAALLLLAGVRQARATSDLAPPESRRATVELAQRLTHPAPLTPPPVDMVQPFNPAAFGQPDPEELRALEAARAAAAAASTQAKPTTDHDFLAIIAAKIMPSGTVMLGDESFLIFGKQRLRVGDHFTVNYDGHDYDLELTNIDHTTFTLRLNHDEITRPIKPAK